MKPRMRCAIWLTLAVAINAIFTNVLQAQTNSCISSVDGFWDESRIWSLATPPSIRQSAILITNDASETITIDSTTASRFNSTMTISNLDISPFSAVDILYLDNTGTAALHILNGLTIGNVGGPPGGVAVLISTNSKLIVDGLVGGQLQDNGTIAIAGGSLITTNCSLQVAVPSNNSVGLLTISNAIVRARDITIASGTPSIGTIELVGGTMTLSSSLIVGAGEVGSRGSMLVANASLVITNGGTSIGDGDGSYGIVTLTNSTMLASSMGLGGDRASGNLFIEDSDVRIGGFLTLYYGEISLNGGKLVITNAPTTLGIYTGFGEITVEDGLFLAREIIIGNDFQEDGFLTVNGGTVQLSSYLQIGSGSPDNESDGDVFISGGRLTVPSGEIIIQSYSTVTVTGGLLEADYIDLDSGYIGTGTLSINGGSVTASRGITLGDCASNAFGYVSVDGGELTVTNAAHTGFIDLQNGQLVLSGGTLRVDKLVMTNSCSSFVHTSGTLIAGSVVLDPNAFAITSIAREGNDLLITWRMAPGATNALQVSSGGLHGAYTTNTFTDIFVVTNNTTTGTLTNYLDIGAATNRPARYYRARLSP